MKIKHMRIHFFQPELFNRTKRKTNPFFDPLIEVCEREHIPYKVFVMERNPSPNGYGTHYGNSWILMWPEILGLRFIKWFKLPSRFVWRIVGGIMNLITFGRYRADVCITVACVHLDILQGIAPKARLVDLQHGVIYSKHSGYFEKDGAFRKNMIERCQCEYWLYGEGYKNVFFKHPSNAKYLAGKVHVIGDVMGASMPIVIDNTAKKDAIVFSLQFKPDFSKEFLENDKKLFESVLRQIEVSGLHEKYRILLKHHPRFCNCTDLSAWEKQFPWAVVCNDTTPELVACAVYHVTCDSTVAFEYASAGVPTCFVWNDINPSGRTTMLEEYQYPGTGTFEEMKDYLLNDANRILLAESVRHWYENFYEPFSSESCLEMLENRDC